MGIAHAFIGINHGAVVISVNQNQRVVYDDLLHFSYQLFSFLRIRLTLQRFIQLVIFLFGIPAVCGLRITVTQIFQRIAGSHGNPVVVIQIIISCSQFAPLIVGAAVLCGDSDPDFSQILGMGIGKII